MKEYYRNKKEEYKQRTKEKIMTQISEIKRRNKGPQIDTVQEAFSQDEVTNDYSEASNKSLTGVQNNHL